MSKKTTKPSEIKIKWFYTNCSTVYKATADYDTDTYFDKANFVIAMPETLVNSLPIVKKKGIFGGFEKVNTLEIELIKVTKAAYCLNGLARTSLSANVLKVGNLAKPNAAMKKVAKENPKRVVFWDGENLKLNYGIVN